MPVSLSYPHDPATKVPRLLPAAGVWSVAAKLRQAVARRGGPWELDPKDLVSAATRLEVNHSGVEVHWDFSHAVHDEDRQPVLGICETDPTAPGIALVSINTSMLANRPDLLLSTVAHELGHVVFDVPSAAGQPARRYRSVSAGAHSFDGATVREERRANEFMGALLAPPVPLHLRLVVHARSEGLRMVNAPHHGRVGCRVLAHDTPPEAISGIVTALAADFGVSDRFIAVRLQRYRLIEGGQP
ncbi:ImmA/IrrE family metallo-endopeptidase [Falsiroseomonas ponticola]|uniref:ImmA/IrrE family metallo-endopeptidase n=1 Tax=Falsiroseomonas ponticola TaxID=2786951 RepID=UPI0019330D9F|nr:ImmA/IrrE family metallo-endopeptidase [Roseomonas ponticola]